MSAFAHQVDYSCCDDFRSFRLTDDLEVVAGFLQSPGARGASRWPVTGTRWNGVPRR